MKNYTIPKNLLSKGMTNAKTAKNNLDTFILYLAPHKQNAKGVNVCPAASVGCVAACLYSAGRGKFSNVQKSRINKTNFYISNKSLFIKKLATEILREYTKAKKKNIKIAFRLNGTSDLDFVYLLQKYAGLDISTLKDHSTFYDYTKLIGKTQKYLNHPNYFVTFSRAENNESTALSVLNMGGSVAVVFSNSLPNFWRGFKVIDGDKSDLEMLYYKNVVLGLKAKGDAKKDDSGFVIESKKDILTKQLKTI